MGLPGKKQLQFALDNAPSNAPGHDGLPSCAWRAVGRRATRLLDDILFHYASGYGMGWAFTSAIFCYPLRKLVLLAMV